MQKFFNLMMKIYVLTLFYKIFKDLDDWVHILKKTRVAALVSFLLPLECLNFLKLMISQIYFVIFSICIYIILKTFQKINTLLEKFRNYFYQFSTKYSISLLYNLNAPFYLNRRWKDYGINQINSKSICFEIILWII